MARHAGQPLTTTSQRVQTHGNQKASLQGVSGSVLVNICSTNATACQGQMCRHIPPNTDPRQGSQLTGSSSEGLLRSMLGNSSGAIQGSVPLMFPLTKVEAFFLDSPRSPILTTGRFRSRRSHRRLSHFCRRSQ